MLGRGIIGVLALLMGVLASVCACAQAVTPDPLATPETRIISGCLLYVHVKDDNFLTRAYDVDAEGYITFRLGDEMGKFAERWKVKVRDLTAAEAKTRITESLKQYFKEPVAKITITRIPRLKVILESGFEKSGEIALPFASRFSDILNLVSPKQDADLARAQIVREGVRNPQQPNKIAPPKTIRVDFLAFQRGESEDDPLLEAGDTVSIAIREKAPERPVSQFVRVLGEVEIEGLIPLTPNMTLAEALKRAGGLKPSARRDRVRYVQGSDGKVFELDADKIESGDPQQNRKLGAGDVLLIETRDQSLILAVGGAVRQPVTIPWRANEKMTVSRALEMAGGMTNKSDGRRGVIRRGYLRNPAGSTPIFFDMALIRTGKQRDWELEAGDDVFVPMRVPRPSFFQSIAPLLLQFLPL